MSARTVPTPDEIDAVIFDMIAVDAAQMPDDTSTGIVLARLPILRDELVIGRDRTGQIDVRLWTDLNGLGVRMASGQGFAFPLELLPQVIELLRAALDDTEAVA